MKYLLDTCVFIWLCCASDKLPANVVRLIEDVETDLLLSHVSLLEITLKNISGKLHLPASPRLWVTEQIQRWCIQLLPIEKNDIFNLSDLPSIHGDPFDRLLVSVAMNRKVAIITPDSMIRSYPVPIVWDE